jgi:hypothetical protein
MNIKWVLVISAIALGSMVIGSIPDREKVLPQQQAGQQPDNASVLQKMPEQGFVINQEVPSSADSSPVTDADSQTSRAMTEGTAVEAQADTQAALPSDAFPDKSDLSADQLAESQVTDEAALELERNTVDLYFPVDEQLAYQPSEAEMEQQRLEHEQQIVEQADALENQPYPSEDEFDMPPFEH